MSHAAHGPSALLRWSQAFFKRHARLARFLDRVARPLEIATKKPVFGCKMCGQCTLHETGLTCPMGCPKTLRNGPCGGVRMNGHCEVIPSMMCVWVKAERRARWLPWGGAILRIQPALDWSLRGSSAWMNLFSGRTGRPTP
ncbi:MAG TPA: methylenetetrahydrofolate reductase C-terminal domain-containing protein [Candidatus Polarisedimenticolia bacterium]